MPNYFYELPEELQDMIYYFDHIEKYKNVRLELNNVFRHLLKIENMEYKLYTEMTDDYGIELIDYYDDYIIIERIETITKDICDTKT